MIYDLTKPHPPLEIPEFSHDHTLGIIVSDCIIVIDKN